MMTDWKALCAELLDEIPHESPTTCLARAALAQQEPEELTDEELLAICDGTPWRGSPRQFGLRVSRAAIAADRARFGRPASQPIPVSERLPGVAHVWFEFAISDADYCTQAGGTAPTYSQALSEGQHYLAQYLQDGPHTLELRRVEVLAHALPHP